MLCNVLMLQNTSVAGSNWKLSFWKNHQRWQMLERNKQNSEEGPLVF